VLRIALLMSSCDIGPISHAVRSNRRSVSVITKPVGQRQLQSYAHPIMVPFGFCLVQIRVVCSDCKSVPVYDVVNPLSLCLSCIFSSIKSVSLSICRLRSKFV